jgi:hypothetical protein
VHYSIDDYQAIRARRDELRCSPAAISDGLDALPEEWLTPEALERKYGQSVRPEQVITDPDNTSAIAVHHGPDTLPEEWLTPEALDRRYGQSVQAGTDQKPPGMGRSGPAPFTGFSARCCA